MKMRKWVEGANMKVDRQDHVGDRPACWLSRAVEPISVNPLS